MVTSEVKLVLTLCQLNCVTMSACVSAGQCANVSCGSEDVVMIMIKNNAYLAQKFVSYLFIYVLLLNAIF